MSRASKIAVGWVFALLLWVGGSFALAAGASTSLVVSAIVLGSLLAGVAGIGWLTWRFNTGAEMEFLFCFGVAWGAAVTHFCF